MAKVFKIRLRSGSKSTIYYGKVRHGPNHWRRVGLYTDKAASTRKLADLQREADQFDAGVRSAAAEKLKLPITALRDEYIGSLRTAKKAPAHVRISEFMLNKLIDLGGWHGFRDISRESVEQILTKLEEQGRTVAYRNKFVARAKAFVRHWLPDGYADPLRKLRRISEKGATRTRGRRAASVDQVGALLTGSIPDDRKLAYALAALNGLRRNEVHSLTWGQLHLAAPIPFVAIGQKMGDAADVIPLHRHVVQLLGQRIAAMPAARVLRSVPDVSTLEKDWQGVGVGMTDAAGLRLDYHALRHTFSTRLDQTGCSRATKKKLMRHAAEDVTDGYAHAELAEMRAALDRIPTPSASASAAAVKTGTSDRPVDRSAASAEVDQITDDQRQSLSTNRTDYLGQGERRRDQLPIDFASAATASDHHRDSSSLIGAGAPDTVGCTRPSTQVD